MDPEVSALKLAFSINNEWFEWSTIVVIVGLVFELVTLLAVHRTTSWREKTILIAGTLIIAIGVAGEWHFGSKASAAALRLQAIADEKVAVLSKDAAEAKKGAADASERAAQLEKDAEAARAAIAIANAKASQANERAAELEKQSASAQKAIAEADARAAEATQKATEAQLTLERLKQPRTLGPLRQQFVSDAVMAFAGQRYEGAVSQAADDGILYWESIYAALSKAGWLVVPMPPGQPGVGDPVAGIPIAAAPGVEIVFDSAKEAELARAALALGNALHADGTVVAVNRNDKSNPNEADRDILLIRIGARVPPQ
jgi:hypothetical protein